MSRNRLKFRRRQQQPVEKFSIIMRGLIAPEISLSRYHLVYARDRRYDSEVWGEKDNREENPAISISE